VITVQLNRVYGPNPEGKNWSRVREAQRQAARRDPLIGVAPAIDLPLTDGIHNSPAGNMALGTRMALIALQRAYGKQIVADAPDIVSTRLEPGGKEIALKFAPVTSFLGTINVSVNPFNVADANGPVEISEVVYPPAAESDTVVLKLTRVAEGDIVVDGGLGTDPTPMPYDMGRIVPALAFHDVAVKRPIPR
jgi:hypothetical protein